MLARQLAVGAPYLLLRGPLRYPQNLVEIPSLHTLNLSRNHNLSGTDGLAVEQVSPLEGLEDRAFFVLVRGLAHNGLMDVGVEGLPVRGDGQETLLAERVGELLAGCAHALADVALGLEGAVQVIEDGEQLHYEPLGGRLEEAGPFALLALARVLELGLQAAQSVEVLVPLPARLLELHGQGGQRLLGVALLFRGGFGVL